MWIFLFWRILANNSAISEYDGASEETYALRATCILCAKHEGDRLRYGAVGNVMVRSAWPRIHPRWPCRYIRTRAFLYTRKRFADEPPGPCSLRDMQSQEGSANRELSCDRSPLLTSFFPAVSLSRLFSFLFSSYLLVKIILRAQPGCFFFNYFWNKFRIKRFFFNEISL